MEFYKSNTATSHATDTHANGEMRTVRGSGGGGKGAFALSETMTTRERSRGDLLKFEWRTHKTDFISDCRQMWNACGFVRIHCGILRSSRVDVRQKRTFAFANPPPLKWSKSDLVGAARPRVPVMSMIACGHFHAVKAAPSRNRAIES